MNRHLLLTAIACIPIAGTSQKLSHADATLKMKPTSVVEKSLTPSSGNKHAYLSLAPYFWPDKSKPDGKPYLRRDGELNPESRNESTDHRRMTSLYDQAAKVYPNPSYKALAGKLGKKN